jgi:hypothetical protein
MKLTSLFQFALCNKKLNDHLDSNVYLQSLTSSQGFAKNLDSTNAYISELSYRYEGLMLANSLGVHQCGKSKYGLLLQVCIMLIFSLIVIKINKIFEL